MIHNLYLIIGKAIIIQNDKIFTIDFLKKLEEKVVPTSIPNSPFTFKDRQHYYSTFFASFKKYCMTVCLLAKTEFLNLVTPEKVLEGLQGRKINFSNYLRSQVFWSIYTTWNFLQLFLITSFLSLREGLFLSLRNFMHSFRNRKSIISSIPSYFQRCSHFEINIRICSSILKNLADVFTLVL